MNDGRNILKNVRAKRCYTAQKGGKSCLPSGGSRNIAALFVEILSTLTPALRYIPQRRKTAGKAWYTRNATSNCIA